MTERLLAKVTDLRDGEARPTLLAMAYFFTLLCAYYVMRPLREEMGLAGGVRNLPWMFQATLAATFLATPLFGWCVHKYPRHVLLPVVYRFFALNTLGFFVAAKLLPESADVVLGRVFYVWLSVFNMFVVSVFWAFLADGFGLGQSKRLFGLIAAGGSLGAMAGSSITSFLVEPLGRLNLLLVSVVLLEVCVRLIQRLHRAFEELQSQRENRTTEQLQAQREQERALWRGPFGGAFNGVGQTFKSPYLLGISAFLFLYSLGSTFLYFEQAHIVDAAVTERPARAALFARIDLWVNALSLTTQLFLSGRIMSRLGVPFTLITLPVLSVVGFVTLGFSPTLAVLVVFQVLRRASNYALIRPARESLFTIVRREERYKAKSFIDTFVYRGGDSLGSLLFDRLVAWGMGLGAIAGVAAAAAGVWGIVGWNLGRAQSRISERQATTRPASEPEPEPSPGVA